MTPVDQDSQDNLAAGRMLMVAILLLAAAMRFARLDAQSMWFDEAARLLIAQGDVLSIVRETGGDTLPPLYHLMMHFWGLVGQGDLWLRLPSAFSGLLLVAVVASLGWSLFGLKTGLVASFIVAIMPYQVFQSQQASLYSPLVLLAAIQILSFWRVTRGGGRIWFIAYVFSAAAGMYLHYFAGLITLTLNLWLLLVGLSEGGQRLRRRWTNVLAADAFIFILSLPLVAYFLRGMGDVGGDFWLTRPNIVAPLSTLHLFTVSYSLSGIWAAAGFVLTLILVALVFLELAYAYRRQPEQRPALILLFLLAFLPILLTFVISQWVPIYLDRTLIITSPAYALLLGRALATTRLRSPVPYVAGGILALMILSVYGYYFNGSYSKPDYRAAAAYVDDWIEEGEALVHTSNGSYIPFLYYLGSERHFLLEGDPAPHHPPLVHEVAGGRSLSRADLAAWPGVWLVVAFDHSLAYQEATLAEFDTEYPRSHEAVIDGIVVRRYDLSAE